MLKGLKYFFPLIVLFVSCKKDPPTVELVHEGTIEVNVTNVAGNQVLALNTGTYINQSDTFNVTRFRYYVSNIRLHRDDNFTYIEKESYRLLDAEDSTSCKFTLTEVPYGNYTGIEFIIGVDSLRNCSGAQTGALDPAVDMFWSWNQGYIFAKMEGTCPTAPGGGFIYHVGGFSGPFNAIVSAKPSFNNAILNVDAGHSTKLFMKADVLEWFKNPSLIDFSSYSAISGGKKARELAYNYSDMFSVSEIRNQ